MNDLQTLTSLALRYRALYLDIQREDIDMHSTISAPVMAFLERMSELGYSVDEELLHALGLVSPDTLLEILNCVDSRLMTNLNWAALVKGWDTPTGESVLDHLVTLLINSVGGENSGFKGVTLPCGHFIPDGTFPMERYTGCPFCGRPFLTADYVYKGQGSKKKMLRLFTPSNMEQLFMSLLTSPTPLDGTQKDSLKMLLKLYDVPVGIEIPMKETVMLVVDALQAKGLDDQATHYLENPTDILRFLWFKKTGLVQIIEPRLLIGHAKTNYRHIIPRLDYRSEAQARMRQMLKLKYPRKDCAVVAGWLNKLPMSATRTAEDMHPHRGMWVRLIRALRLGEYSRRPGMEHLAEILDVFYKQDYTTWQGRLEQYRNANDADATLRMLQQRPGLFARCLFASMLRFGAEKTLAAFDEVSKDMPSRLLISLINNAEIYFDKKSRRSVRVITGNTHVITPNKLLALYSDEDLDGMIKGINSLYTKAMARKFASEQSESESIYIAPELYNIPISVGDRATTIQDLSCALMGTRIRVDGDAVRLFLQWGVGCPAQHMDMDLSCRIAYSDGKVNHCYFGNLSFPGAKHSGDIREIPHMVGTAEYIELDIPTLEAEGAQYVTFVCNAYSIGAMPPDLSFGWMCSEYPMTVSNEDGVAYDPSCVQHMVRISETNFHKGLVCGVLDVKSREIIWLEMPIKSQTVFGASGKAVEALLRKLSLKCSIGDLLETKMRAQNLVFVENPEDADEAYTLEWALNPAEVSRLLG